MLKNYFKFTWRHLVKDRQFTLLNVLGLSTSLACAILIYIWVSNERSMDDFHTNNARLYQVMAHIKLPDGIHTQEVTPGMLAGALGREMPEVDQAVAVQEVEDALTIGKEHFRESAEFVKHHWPDHPMGYRFDPLCGVRDLRTAAGKFHRPVRPPF